MGITGTEVAKDSAAMILTLITVGKMLEARSKGKTTDALRGLLAMKPKTAVLLTDQGEQTVSIERVKPGDRFVVRSGETIPTDGEVLEGSGYTAAVTLRREAFPLREYDSFTLPAGEYEALRVTIGAGE